MRHLSTSRPGQPPPKRDGAPEPSVKVKEALSGLARAPDVFRLVFRAAPVAAAGLCIANLAYALVPLAVAFAGKRIVDAVMAHDRAVALRYVAIEFLLIAVQTLASRATQLLQSMVGGRLVIAIHVLILEKALALELKHFESHEFYDRLMRARSEASMRPVSFLGGVMRLGSSAITFVGFVALLGRYSGWAVLALVLAAVPSTFVEGYYSRRAFALRNWRSPDRRRLAYTEYVLANDGHVKEVKLLDLGPRLLARYKRLSDQFFGEEQVITRRRAFFGYLLSLLSSVAFYGAYATMAASTALGALTLGNLTLYIAAFRSGQQAFAQSLGTLGELYEDSLYLSNLFSFLAIPVPERLVLPASEVLPEEGLRLEHVGFRYPFPEDSAWVFRDLSLTIPRGQALALVGPNGAGKTTLIKLITGLYEPTTGRVLLDGRDVRSWDPVELRRRFSAVFQDFNRYQFTARDNVSLGSPTHSEDAERIGRAVEKGGAAELVADLPRGLDTQLGTWFKGGTELSGGQWQKLGLARAFMREESDILILDEPTAALDAETEYAVFQRFQELAAGRTTILISHRFPTVRMADRIIVLEHGAIIEEGTHEALLEKNGRYAELFTLQARGYR